MVNHHPVKFGSYYHFYSASIMGLFWHMMSGDLGMKWSCDFMVRRPSS